jgi:hypothetical protein
MDQVDTFVLLDTVQFDKRSWQQRNRIKGPAGLQWLTVPVISRGKYDQKIQDVKILDTSFVRTHLKTLELHYSPTPHFAHLFPRLASILGRIEPGSPLAELNTRLLQCIVDVLGIRTHLVPASSLNEEGRRTGLLANICRRLKANQYISPVGSAEYLLSDLAVIAEANVETLFHNYVHPQYEQRFSPFVPFASVIDLIFNEGDRAMEVIRSGRRTLLTPTQVAAEATEAKEA